MHTIRRNLACQTAVFLVRYNKRRLAVSDDLSQLRPGQSGIKSDINFPCFQYAKNCDNRRRSLIEQKCNRFLTIATRVENRMCDPVALFIQSLVRESVAVVANRSSFGLDFHLALETTRY